MAHSEVIDPYKTIVDRYDGTVYSNMIVVVLDGVTSYNSYVSYTPPFKWIIHPNWYTTAADSKNPQHFCEGGLRRSVLMSAIDAVDGSSTGT